MIKKYIKILIITSIIILLPIVAGIYFWNQLPDPMPVHWNFSGDVDGWASKTFTVIFFPFLLLGIHWLCLVGTTLDPKHDQHSGKMLTFLLWFVPVLSIILNGFLYAFALGKDIKVEVVTPLLIGIIFTIVGNYLPKCRQNYTIGFKIPWTLHSEENWNKTHRLGGIVWTIGGALTIISTFIGFTALLLPIMLAMVFVPIIYSYLLYRKGI